MSDVLARILADKRAHVDARKRVLPFPELESAALAAPPVRHFAAHLADAASTGYGLIAEIKRASPSKGLIREDFEVAALAQAYALGGATCLSVLTDVPYFQGSDADLTAARAAVALPVLRKDFIIDPYQVAEARAIGADAILVIMAAVDYATARDLSILAHDFGMDVLVEVHDASELDRALRLGTSMVGINNRDLKTLAVDLGTVEHLAPRVPADRLVVAESGLSRPEDLARLAAIGIRCFLVGEGLMRQPDVAAATRTLLSGSIPA
ncbi:MAG: indole-3-glycerol phosphate synthase TrpC [Rhodospirillales bacterium]|nr:MAG: indole-3-glycerol phosphate synthase TrpC [Rhodospirillales bacterium]